MGCKGNLDFFVNLDFFKAPTMLILVMLPTFVTQSMHFQVATNLLNIGDLPA